MQQFKYTLSTPIGKVTLRANQNAITGLKFGAEYAELEEKKTPLLEQATKQLQEYFAGTRKKFDLPLEFNGTPFQNKVWQTLCLIPYGETRSYQDIAIQVGCPKGPRAIGMANNRNPIAIIAACHRVIGKNGSLVGFAVDIGIKENLLKLEAQNK